MAVKHYAPAHFLGLVLSAGLAAGGVSGQTVSAPESDSGYLASLDDMALDMDLGSIASETYDTIVVDAPQLSQSNDAASNANSGEMDCESLKTWMAKQDGASAGLTGVNWAGQDYQAALTACAFTVTEALALAD